MSYSPLIYNRYSGPGRYTSASNIWQLGLVRVRDPMALLYYIFMHDPEYSDTATNQDLTSIDRSCIVS